MKPINVEITMGHSIGISASYYKPTESEVLKDYLRAIDLLTVSNDSISLKKQVGELQQKSKDNEYIIRGKMQERDEEMRSLSAQLHLMQSQMQTILSIMSQTDSQDIKKQIAEQLIQLRLYKAAD